MYAAEDVEFPKIADPTTGVERARHWAELTPGVVWQTVGLLFKANLWEVLAIIGVVQILLIPVIAASTRVRTIAWIGSAWGVTQAA